MENHSPRFINRFGFLAATLLGVAIVFVSGAHTAFAAVTITAATGGSAISADTTSGTYTTLIGPVITESATAEIGTGTIVLNAPSGFIFDTGGTAPTALVTRTAGSGNNNRNINNLASGSTIAVTRTTSTLSITITDVTSNGVRNSLTWQNVRVRPSAGTPLASGTIVKTGTSVISGVTNSVTSFGTLTEVAGALNHFAFAAIGTQTVGVPFSITMTAQDTYNNTKTGFTGTVDLSTNTGTIAPLLSGAFLAGVRTESISLTGSGIGRTITATDHAGTGATGTSAAFTVVATATKFVILPPASGTVGTPTIITVQAQKPDGSVDTNYQQDVTLHATGSATGGGVVDIVNGVGTIHISDTVAETVTLSLIDSQGTGLDVSSTQPLAFAAGAVARYVLNNPGDMYAKSRLGYTVSRQDSYGNAVGSATSTVYLYSSSTSGTKKFYNDSLAGSVITSIDIVPGHSTANFWYYDEAPGTYTISGSDNASAPDGATGISDGTDPVTVMPVATKFVILPPANGTVDAPVTVTVQAQKPDDSIDTNYQQDVTLHATGSATGGGVVDIVNGVGTKNISDTVAETVTLSLVDSQGTGLDVSSTHPLTFAGGVIAQFTLSHPAASEAGQRAEYTVTREDQYGNPSSQATTTVYLYSSSTGANKRFYDAVSGGSVITSVQIPNGQSAVNVWYYDTLPGTWSITASDNASAPDYNTGINDAVDSHEVTAGPVAQFLLDNPGNMTAGTRLGYTVTRKDQFNNSVTIGATTVYLYSNSAGPGGAPEFYASDIGGSPITSIIIPDGQSVIPVWYFDPNTGMWTVTASDATPVADGAIGVIDAEDSVTVEAAPIVATRFVIQPIASGTVDAPITVTVQAEDGSGNLDTTYQNDVTLHASGSATGAGLVDIVNGVGSLAIHDAVAETVDFSLTDSQTTGLDASSARSAVFAPGAVTQFSLDNPGDVAAGTRIKYTVGRKDQYGNAVTSGATTVYLYSTSTGVNKKFYDAASGGSSITFIVIPNGASAVSFWAYDEKAGNWFITVSDNASAPDVSGINDASDELTVQPAAVAKFVLDDPGDMTAGTRLGYTVTRKDSFDNLVTSGVTLAYLYSSSAATTTAFYSTGTGGAPTAFATINDGASSGDFWYYDETPGTWLVTASDSTTAPPNGAAGIADAVDSVTVSAIPIVATKFVILPPVTVQVGTPATVTVEAQDDAGNVDTTITSGVTLHATGSATGAGLVSMTNGVGTITLSDSVAETVTLSLSDTQSTHLDVSSTQTLTFSASPVAPNTGGAGGPGARVVPNIIGVQLSGRAFPGAQVQILAASPQGTNVQGQTTASASGSFTALLGGVGVGASSYGLVGVDPLGRTTQIKTFNASYASPNTLLDISSVLLSPTVGLVHPTVRKNDIVGFVGYAMPGYRIFAQVDGRTISQWT